MAIRFRSIPFLPFALALAVGVFGGAVFAFIGTPLPWMLGSMCFCLVAAIMGLKVRMPSQARVPMSMVIGVMLGSTFAPGMLDGLLDWIVPVLGLVAFLFTSAAAGILYYMKIGKYSFTTAYFCGMPGGLAEMLLLGEHYRADLRRIALAHSARILLVVFSVPFLIQILAGVEFSSGERDVVSIGELTPDAWAWFIGTMLGGALLGHILRLPAKFLIGPMVLSVIVHGTGLTGFKPPIEIVIIAQVVLGASIGCRFVGTPPRELATVLTLSVGSTAVLLSVTLAFAYGISLLSPFSIVELILAYSPAGVAEMGLVALALQIEVAFVTCHHILRIFAVSLGAAAIAHWRMPDPEPGD